MRNLSLLLCAAALASTTGLPPVRPLPSPAPGDDALTVRDTRHYVMAGSVRPLLFWIGRDDIGLARIVWRGGPAGARGYEFLVGTDPARAPRGLNRWGFISEQIHGGSGRLFALMTATDADSYDEAAAGADDEDAAARFRAISGTVAAGASVSQVARVSTPVILTVHDADVAVERLQPQTGRAAPETRAVQADVRPGFLTAVAEVIDATTQAGGAPGKRPRPAATRYAFGQGTYELRLRSLETDSVDGFAGLPALRGEFEIRTLATGARTRFEVTWATTGALAGVPLHIAWQPRWWLKVDLRLDAAESTTARR